MFWNRFKRTPNPKPPPEELDGLREIRNLIRRAPPGAAIDPEVIARMASLPLGVVLALLQLLSENREGKLELRVVNDRGIEIGAFQTLREIPASVEDEFGDVTEVMPENVELVFRASR